MGFISALFGKKEKVQWSEGVREGAFLVDVRSPAEFSAGSVKGAVNVPLDKLLDQLSRFKGKKYIVVFCRSGARSGQAKHTLEKKGFSNVINGGSLQQVGAALNE